MKLGVHINYALTFKSQQLIRGDAVCMRSETACNPVYLHELLPLLNSNQHKLVVEACGSRQAAVAHQVPHKYWCLPPASHCLPYGVPQPPGDYGDLVHEEY